MSISNSIGAALSGLNAAARRAELVSSNIANAMTEGYGRRTLSVSGGLLGGVRVDGVERHVDRGLIADRRLADAGVGAQRQMSDHFARIERLLGDIGAEGALTSRLSDVQSALVSATADPGSDVRLNRVVDRFHALTGALNDTADGLQSLRMETEATITNQVDQLNGALSRVEKLNADIGMFRSRGVDPSPLMDARQQAIDTIAALVPVRELDRQNGAVALMTASGQVLLDSGAAEIGFSAATYITAGMTLGSGALSGLTINGDPVADGVGKLAGGALGASFALRDDVLDSAQVRLDAIARDLLERFGDNATDPSLAPGDAGLLTDAGGSFDPLDTAGLSARIALNSAVDPDQGGALHRLRDGVAAMAAGPAGETAQLERWIGAMQEQRPTHLGGAVGSASGHLSAMMADIGGQRLSVDQDLAFQTARWETLKEAELATGVDTDTEMQTLLQIEQAYAANAKVLQTVDIMMQRVLEI